MSDDRENKKGKSSKTRKPSVSHRHAIVAAVGENTPYYVPHLKEFRSIKDLTQEDRESIAANLFGPSKSKARDELIQQMKKLAGDEEEP